jgi:hypothetical protein
VLPVPPAVKLLRFQQKEEEEEENNNDNKCKRVCNLAGICWLKVEALSFRFGIGEERQIKSAGGREREREKDWVFFLTNLGDFGSSAWGTLRIGFCWVG